jgi:hypothetical protein
MLPRSAALRLVLACTVGLTLLAGCSSGEPLRNHVKGKLTRGDKVLEFDPMTGGVEMYFVPMKGNERPPAWVLPEGAGTDGGGKVYVEVFPAQVLPTGEYFVDGGIPDGRYLVTVRHFPQAKKDEVPLDNQDTLKGEYSIFKSRIVSQVSGSMTLDIDLGKTRK